MFRRSRLIRFQALADPQKASSVDSVDDAV